MAVHTVVVGSVAGCVSACSLAVSDNCVLDVIADGTYVPAPPTIGAMRLTVACSCMLAVMLPAGLPRVWP